MKALVAASMLLAGCAHVVQPAAKVPPASGIGDTGDSRHLASRLPSSRRISG